MIQQRERTTIAQDQLGPPDLFYPESDGKPLADNTLQFSLIIKIQGGIDALFVDDPHVFVRGTSSGIPSKGP